MTLAQGAHEEMMVRTLYYYRGKNSLVDAAGAGQGGSPLLLAMRVDVTSKEISLASSPYGSGGWGWVVVTSLGWSLEWARWKNGSPFPLSNGVGLSISSKSSQGEVLEGPCRDKGVQGWLGPGKRWYRLATGKEDT